jgi:beta-glucanase (GH16 family)
MLKKASGNTRPGSRGWAWLTAVVAVLCSMPVMAQDLPGWTLVWSDEFDGPDIDASKWSHEVNAWGGGNNELQYYTDRPANSFIENGHLVIQALKENYTGPEGKRNYTSARLRTLNKGDWTYGRFEARMKLPYGQGLWPAFWMLPTDWVYGGWAASGEIDIMEIVGHQPNVLHGTIHYGGEWPNNVYSGASYTLPAGDFSDDFHVFAIEWEHGEIRWYVDGIHYSTKNSWRTDSGAPFPAPFDERFHILLNVAVGGNWPGNPDGTTIFPQRMEVDYVRVYSATNTPTSSTPYYGAPQTIPGTIEAEDYDNGGQSVAYYDMDAANNDGVYRPAEYVDIEACTDSGGGYNVGRRRRATTRSRPAWRGEPAGAAPSI